MFSLVNRSTTHIILIEVLCCFDECFLSGIARVGGRGGPPKVVRCLMPPYHPNFSHYHPHFAAQEGAAKMGVIMEKNLGDNYNIITYIAHSG